MAFKLKAENYRLSLLGLEEMATGNKKKNERCSTMLVRIFKEKETTHDIYISQLQKSAAAETHRAQSFITKELFNMHRI